MLFLCLTLTISPVLAGTLRTDASQAPARLACNAMNKDWCEYFTYNQETGDLYWRHRPIEHFKNAHAQKSWNTRFANKIAGCGPRVHARTGRLDSAHVKLHGLHFRVPRIIWEMHNGPIPSGIEVDHKDRNPANNRLCNLRLATSSQNKINRTTSRGRTGYRGVYKPNGRSMYIARIWDNGIKVVIGSFPTAALAYAARCEAEAALYGEFSCNDTIREVAKLIDP